MDNNGHQWTTIDNNGQQWTTMDNNLRNFMHRFLLSFRQRVNSCFHSRQIIKVAEEE